MACALRTTISRSGYGLTGQGPKKFSAGEDKYKSAPMRSVENESVLRCDYAQMDRVEQQAKVLRTELHWVNCIFTDPGRPPRARFEIVPEVEMTVPFFVCSM